MTTRRQWLAGVAGGLVTGATAVARDEAGAATIITVLGPIPASEAGFVLPHEHVLVDFIGADRVSRDRYETEDVTRAAGPHLARARGLGVRTILECTPAYLGRDPGLLARLSRETGVNLVTNTGYYAANGGKHLPATLAGMTAEQVAGVWIEEARKGIDGTGIRPGFVKIGYDAGPLNAAAVKLVEAAAVTRRATGLAVAAHSGDGRAAAEALERFVKAGATAGGFVWVHAQNEQDPGRHAAIAEQGGWVEFDGIGPSSLERHLELVRGMKLRGNLDRVLLSHDAGWYHVGEPGGGEFRGYDTLVEKFLPALREAGCTVAEIAGMTVSNPAAAFGVARADQGVRPGAPGTGSSTRRTQG